MKKRKKKRNKLDVKIGKSGDNQRTNDRTNNGQMEERGQYWRSTVFQPQKKKQTFFLFQSKENFVNTDI